MTHPTPPIEFASRTTWPKAILFVLMVGCASFPDGYCAEEPEVSSWIEKGTGSVVDLDGMKTELLRVDQEVPEPMVLLAQTMLGASGQVEYDPSHRIVGLRGEPERVEQAIKYLADLNDTYEESTRRELMESNTESNPWAQTAKYFGKLQPGESVQIEALLLACSKGEPSKTRLSAPPQPKSKKEALEDVLLDLDKRKRDLLKRAGSDSPELETIKSQMSAIIELLDRENRQFSDRLKELTKRLEMLRDDVGDRIQIVDSDSSEQSLMKQEIIEYNQLLEEAKRNPGFSVEGRIIRILKSKGIDLSGTEPADEEVAPTYMDIADLPLEARMMGLDPESLGLFGAGRVEALGQTTLRATVFGSDSNGIAFTTVSDYSLEFRLGHSTIGVTVALIPERTVRDQSKGIQGVVTRLNKILLDTETEVEINRPIVVGGYSLPDGPNLVLAVQIKK